jgi:hypothetical protein
MFLDLWLLIPMVISGICGRRFFIIALAIFTIIKLTQQVAPGFLSTY